MDETFKNKIRNSVILYKDIFSTEYRDVVKQIESARKNLKNEYAEAEFDDGRPNIGLKRELYRVPEKLYAVIINNIDQERLDILDSKEYVAWFIKEYPEFRMTSKY